MTLPNLISSRYCLVLSLVTWINGQLYASDKVEFNRDVRPILSDNCFFCHGPDNNKREADLRLDTHVGLIGKDGMPGVVVPNKPMESELYRRLITEDAEQRMPPESSHKSLTVSQIATLRTWIEQGAEYETHWAYMPLKPLSHSRSLAPESNRALAIDQLIFEMISRRGLVAVPKADPVTLIRRLHFDLIGLPPQPEDIDAYLEDPSMANYEKQVDRLLSSPHFGERMAIWWLDLVRYADTVGYHGDQDMSVSPFRDFVIDSFNANKPFDLFTREQLAGDLMPTVGRTEKIASGYNRLGMMSAEGGVQNKEYLAKYIAERVRNVSGTWLGITMGCCECHDHKFDPFSTKEFYQMEAFFADIKEQGLYSGSESTGKWGSAIQVPTPEQETMLKAIDESIAKVRTLLSTSTQELDIAQNEWENGLANWISIKPESVHSEKGATLTIRDDHSILASGDSPDTDTYTLKLKDIPKGVSAIRIEVIPDNSLPQKGPGRAGNGNFVLSEIVARYQLADQREIPIEFSSASASYEQTGAAGGNPYGKWAVAAAIDKDVKGAKWGWAIMEQVGQSNEAVFVLNSESSSTDSATMTIELRQNLDNPKHTIGCFRVWMTTKKTESADRLLIPPEINKIVSVPAGQRTEEQNVKLATHYRGIAPLLQPMRDELISLEKKRSELDKSITVTLITEAVEPRTVRVLPRGNWMDESGEEVKPAFPVAISTPSFQSPPDQRLTRLDLSRWITASDNPLTSRVFVNRVWKLFFGNGLSRRLDDVGAQGEPPTHPDLLDHLAIEFVQSGWNVKQLIRSIVMSEAYQRSSTPSTELAKADPENHWLARQGRFRLDAELVRDNALAVSGLLVSTVGGKSVKPYQPPGYWAYLNFPTREWKNGDGQELYRRGLYTHWQRQYLHPSLMAFDAPSREECTADRPRSNTPLQSLALLNDPGYVEAARVFASMILSVGGASDEARLRFAFRRALSRNVSEAETKLILELLHRAKSEYENQPEMVKSILRVGQSPTPENQKGSDIAAWTAITRVILNLHESVTRY